MFKVSTSDFTRKRLLDFYTITVLILYNYKLPNQNKLNRFYKTMGQVLKTPSSVAFTLARKKLKPEFYEDVNMELVNSFYETYSDEEDQKKGYYKGKRLFGLDGSAINLPDTEATCKRFSIQECGIPGKERVQGMGSFLYDLLNELVISIKLEEKISEEQFLFESHEMYWFTGNRNYEKNI